MLQLCKRNKLKLKLMEHAQQLMCFHHRRQRPGVAGVATPNIWPAGVVLCWQPPNMLTSVFIFSPSAELLNTASRCHFHLQCAQCIVFNSTVEHMKLKNNTSRMHHMTPFWNKKFINFLGRGITPPRLHPPCRLWRLDSRFFGARPATPNVPVALTPMAFIMGISQFYLSCRPCCACYAGSGAVPIRVKIAVQRRCDRAECQSFLQSSLASLVDRRINTGNVLHFEQVDDEILVNI